MIFHGFCGFRGIIALIWGINLFTSAHIVGLRQQRQHTWSSERSRQCQLTSFGGHSLGEGGFIGILFERTKICGFAISYFGNVHQPISGHQRFFRNPHGGFPTTELKPWEYFWYGSKPFTPGKHQNSWVNHVKWMFSSQRNGIGMYGYWSIATLTALDILTRQWCMRVSSVWNFLPR